MSGHHAIVKSFGDIEEYPISKDLKISWLIERILLMQESSVLNPDWFEESRLFLEKSKASVKKAFKYFPINR